MTREEMIEKLRNDFNRYDIAAQLQADGETIARLEAENAASQAWALAQQAHVDAVGTYNSVLKGQTDRGIFPPRVEPEYREMRRTEDTANARLKEMFAALRPADKGDAP